MFAVSALLTKSGWLHPFNYACEETQNHRVCRVYMSKATPFLDTCGHRRRQMLLFPDAAKCNACDCENDGVKLVIYPLSHSYSHPLSFFDTRWMMTFAGVFFSGAGHDACRG